ncbi:MAG TPA: PhzF family phenazine biosynthesis protein [Sediminibacterium sp.]|nr:PhzF family phenazine biosynthesis protein [Sediminibacterium sp.]
MNTPQYSIHLARAFSDNAGLEGKQIIGNPAAIVLCRNAFPSDEDMGTIARTIDQPIVAFLLQQAENHFQIVYYFPDGEPCYLCGHGTLASAYFIQRLFGYQEAALTIRGHAYTIQCRMGDTPKIQAELGAYLLGEFPDPLVDNYLALLHSDRTAIEEAFFSQDLQDIVLVMKSSRMLRDLQPDYFLLSDKIRKDHYRALMVTAASENPAIDYEIRIFCPYVDEDEDISCGSANCYLLPYWKKKLHSANDTRELNILCPFKPGDRGFGGIEHGNYHAARHTVSIAGIITETALPDAI